MQFININNQFELWRTTWYSNLSLPRQMMEE
jgi:hypothetical protein